MGLQFVVSVGWDGKQQEEQEQQQQKEQRQRQQQLHQSHEGFNFLSDLQTPFACTDEPTMQVNSKANPQLSSRNSSPSSSTLKPTT